MKSPSASASASGTDTVETYDVIIVGAGVAGGILALELGHRGHRVLVLEAGPGTRDDEEGWRASVEQFYTTVARVPNSPYPPAPQAPQPDVLQYHQIRNGVPDSAGYFVQHGPQPFSSDYIRAKGGTTMHWQATTLRMLPADFEIRTRYGVGCDWPLSYDDLKPYYERAEYEIGVAGDVAAQHLPGVDPRRFWGNYQFPMLRFPESYVGRRFADRLRQARVKVAVGDREYAPSVTPTPQGRNAMPNPAYVNPATGQRGFQPIGTPGDPLRGQRCQGNSSCTPICPVQAKYSALRTLHKAKNPSSPHARPAEIRNQCVASRIVVDPANGRVRHLEYLAYQDGGPAQLRTARAKVYSIAAHSVETAKLLLMSDVANRSDQVGRNLMDHPTMVTWGLMDEPVWPFRGPGSTNAIPTFRDGPFRSQHSAFVVPIDNWGWGWCQFSPGSDLGAAVASGAFGRKLRASLADRLSRQVALQWEFEQLGEPGNRVTLDRNFLDPLGLPRPVIHYRMSDYVLKAMEAVARISSTLFRKLNIQDFTRYDENAPGYVVYRGRGYQYLGCGHTVGTHRMGSLPQESVTDSWMRAWDHPNLYLVGCGSMPTLGTSNPTLTMAALAFRAADAIARDLESFRSP